MKIEEKIATANKRIIELQTLIKYWENDSRTKVDRKLQSTVS